MASNFFYQLQVAHAIRLLSRHAVTKESGSEYLTTYLHSVRQASGHPLPPAPALGAKLASSSLTKRAAQPFQFGSMGLTGDVQT